MASSRLIREWALIITTLSYRRISITGGFPLRFYSHSANDRFYSMQNVISIILAAFFMQVVVAQPTVGIALNSTGLSSLNYNGTEFLAYGDLRLNEVKFLRADGTLTGGNVNSSVITDNTQRTQTRTYNWGTITVRYATAGNRLNITVTVSNQSPRPMQQIWFHTLGLHFPAVVQEYNGSIPLVKSTLGRPVVQTMSFGSGVMALVADEVAKPLQLGFPWALDKPMNTMFPLSVNIDTVSMYPNSYPKINRPIPAGGSDQYRFSLRFGPPGSTPDNLAADAYQAFAAAFPPIVSWQDRRPIGMLILATAATGWLTNPRGWLSDPSINVTTPAGVASLRQRILAWADRSISILKSMNAQGAITWDIEGEQYPHATTYTCDPRMFDTLAPEMAGIADDYFRRFRDAGLGIGVCIRPQQLVIAPDRSTAQQQFLSDPTQLLIDKVTYAKNRWGATLFYVDSNVNSATDPNAIDPTIFRTLQTRFPDSLFIPEHAVTQYWAYTAPYKELRQGWFSTPAEAKLVYPNSFTTLNTADGPVQQNFNTLVSSVKQGDVLMYRSWFADPANSVVQTIYQTAGANAGVIVTPQTGTVAVGQTLQFSATVTGASSQEVTWTSNPPGVGSVSNTGLYTPPSSIAAGRTATVVATSVAYPAKTASATVTINSQSQVSITITATGGTPQSSTFNTAFTTPLQAMATDVSNNPVGGVPVTFTAPTSGASGTFGSSATAIAVTNSSGAATAPTFTANGQPGTYTVAARVSGLSGQANFTLTNNARASGGSLIVSGDNTSAAGNLTTEGNADWVHWGDASLNRKAGVTAQLSTYTVVGSGSVLMYTNDARSLSWTDGTPTATSSSNTSGIYINGVQNGFSFTAPADTGFRTLTIHVGGWSSSGTLVAHLSDGSAADLLDVTPVVNGLYDRTYTLKYKAAAAGQTLKVTWTMSGGSGNVNLQGAALAVQ